MFTVDKARALLVNAGVFDVDYDAPEQQFRQTLNMNDVWAWASAEGEDVRDDELPELARLFFSYGWAGILYWVSEKNGAMRSEFHDNNRFIDFVKHEEQLRKDVPDSSKRAYTRIRYELGM